MAELERVPPEEAAQIANIAELMVELLKKRYFEKPGEPFVRRGVHPKDHGCVTAKFRVHDALAPDLRVGVFADPGHEFDAFIRFSNADGLVRDDSSKDSTGAINHGSRGMAIKLIGVNGTPLVPSNGPLTQDFLLINQPVFAFSNIEDYEALNRVLFQDNDETRRFFVERIRRLPSGDPDMNDAMTRRAVTTLNIAMRIKSPLMTAPPVTPPNRPLPVAYQIPPASPVDNRYFSAAPFLFGDDRAMKFSANPVAPVLDETPNVADPNYLRTTLRARLARDIVFEFQVQLRAASELAGKIDTEIEDACFEWDERKYPFVPVATITIPAQDFETAERRDLCENLTFTPWHGVAEHRPLGGINRLRLAVYEASTQLRHLPKEPARPPKTTIEPLMSQEHSNSEHKAPARKTLLDTSALIVGYAMSRLNRTFLDSRRYKSWKAAFAGAGKLLDVAPASLKNLRDEFDPVHGNGRRGWVDRPMRPNRQRVMGELCDVSDAALLEMIDRILARDPEAEQDVVVPLSKPAERMSNVAERLRTGRLAEEFFLTNALTIANVAPSLLLDHRTLACGYDFGVLQRERIAIEVKGLKQKRGGIAFTDREWSEAKVRRADFWLVVVGNIESDPIARLIPDPTAALKAECKYQTTIAASWRANVAVA